MSEVADSIDEIGTAIRHLSTARALVNDAKLAIIRVDRKLGPNDLSNDLSSHAKLLENLLREHDKCVTFMEATLMVLKGDDTDIEIVESR
jgi:hypothetical protein